MLRTRSKAIAFGSLRHVVDVEQPPAESDGMGGVSGSWTAFASGVRCLIEPVSGNEQFRAEQTQLRRTHKVTMRRNPDKVPTTAMRLNFGGRLLYVVSIIDLEEKGHWLEISAEERTHD